MKKITRLFLISGAILYSALAVGQTQSSTELLTEQSGIKMFVHHITDDATGQSICQFEFYNTTNKTVSVFFKIKGEIGGTANFPASITLEPGKITQGRTYTGNSYVGLNRQINQIIDSGDRVITLYIDKQ